MKFLSMIAKTARKLWNHFSTDSLFRNSIYLMLSTAVMSLFGFVFWVICSHFFEPSDIGLAASLISAATLMSGLSVLGFNNVIVRFLPTSDKKNAYLSTGFILTSLASFITAAGFLVWALIVHSPTIQVSHFTLVAVIFFIYVLSITINSLIESAFIAYRAAKYVLAKNIILSILKVSLVFFLMGVGFLGIVGVSTFVTTFACCVGFFWLFRKFQYRASLKIDEQVIAEARLFATSNYIGALFGMLPSTVLSLIVLSRLGAKEAAFFYMPAMIVTLLNVIPSSVAQSLFAEISHDESGMLKYLKEAIKNLFLILVPSVIIICLIGGLILRFFGSNYALAGTWPLRILALSSLVGAANYLGDTLLNIKKKAGAYIFMNALNALVIVILAYIMAPYGLSAVAWSSFIGQVVTLIVYVLVNWKLIMSLRGISTVSTLPPPTPPILS